MNTVYKKAAAGEAHGKLILTGEHAVVYGKPAIGIPFPLKARSIVKGCSGNIMFKSAIYTGDVNSVPKKMNGILECIKETLHYLDRPFEGIQIEIDSEIPIGRGLGSSAAISTAIVRSLFSFYGQKLSQEELFTFVNIAETFAHGEPSGIDMAAVTSKAPIWFQKEKDTVQLKLVKPLYMIVADTGRIGDTRSAVENVKRKYSVEPEKIRSSLNKIEKIAGEAKAAILNGNVYLLGKLLDANQKELVTLGVSDNELNELIEAARNAGALGSKLTGGGLGGCIIALGKSLENAKVIAEDLMKAGASKSWYFSTDEDILYVSEVN